MFGFEYTMAALKMWFTIEILVMLATMNTSSSSGSTTKDIEKAFLVQVNGCTGSLVSKNWVICAAHCFKKYRGQDDGKEGIETKLGNYELFVSKLESLADLPSRDNWNQGQTVVGNCSRDSSSYSCPTMRRVVRLIKHKKFKSEALTWQGYDMALLELEPEVQFGMGHSVPVCLPKPGQDQFPGKWFVAGYGHRRIPHCMTDGEGPEAFEVCGRPQFCAMRHRTSQCGLNFLYDGSYHNSCLRTATPSASDPECVALREYLPELSDSKKRIHIFDEQDQYLTTCFRQQPPEGGWCTTRPQGVFDNSEPEPSRGWGFCSQRPEFKQCNERILNNDAYRDSSRKQVNLLEEDYCVDKLEANLKVEQRGVPRSEYSQLRQENRVLCVGQIHRRGDGEDLFYRKVSGSNAGADFIQETADGDGGRTTSEGSSRWKAFGR